MGVGVFVQDVTQTLIEDSQIDNNAAYVIAASAATAVVRGVGMMWRADSRVTRSSITIERSSFSSNWIKTEGMDNKGNLQGVGLAVDCELGSADVVIKNAVVSSNRMEMEAALNWGEVRAKHTCMQRGHPQSDRQRDRNISVDLR